jgi:UDP-4-amino-4,6-dideoxy-L-N-acetyl-beta-L-altrosamine transaminase
MKLKRELPYTCHHLDSQDQEAVMAVFRQPLITRGSQVEAFEAEFAESVGARYAVAFSHGTAAMGGAYFAANTQAGDLVLTSPNSFIASVAGAMQSQARLFFTDIDMHTGNMDLDSLEQGLEARLSRGRKVIVPVHYAGNPIDMSLVEKKIREPDTCIIEDASHALGAKYPTGENVGSCAWSNLTVFSLHPAKTITMGEGGVVTTNDSNLAQSLKLYRNNGIEKDSNIPGHYKVLAITGNYNVSEFHAALGLSQLKRVEAVVKRRAKLIRRYREEIQKISHIKVLKHNPDSANHLFPILIDFSSVGINRKDLMLKLQEEGIFTQVHYIPLYHHPVVKQYPLLTGKHCPNMEAWYERILSLPLFYGLKETEVVAVSTILKSLCK